MLRFNQKLIVRPTQSFEVSCIDVGSNTGDLRRDTGNVSRLKNLFDNHHIGREQVKQVVLPKKVKKVKVAEVDNSARPEPPKKWGFREKVERVTHHETESLHEKELRNKFNVVENLMDRWVLGDFSVFRELKDASKALEKYIVDNPKWPSPKYKEELRFLEEKKESLSQIPDEEVASAPSPGLLRRTPSCPTEDPAQTKTPPKKKTSPSCPTEDPAQTKTSPPAKEAQEYSDVSKNKKNKYKVYEKIGHGNCFRDGNGHGYRVLLNGNGTEITTARLWKKLCV